LQRVAAVAVVEVEELDVGGLEGRQALQRRRGARERDVELPVGAHLEPALRRPRAEGRDVPRRPVPGEPRAVEAARHVRELDRPHEPLGDARALQRREGRIAGHGLEPVAVLVAADGRRQPRATEGQESELQEGLTLRDLLRVREVDRAGPEIADGRRQARVVGQVAEAGVPPHPRPLGGRRHGPHARPRPARDEGGAVGVRGGGAGLRTEPVDELAAQALAGDERAPVAPVAIVAAPGRRDEEAEQRPPADRPSHRSTPIPRLRPSVIHPRDLRVERQNAAVRAPDGTGGLAMKRSLYTLGLATMLAGTLLSTSVASAAFVSLPSSGDQVNDDPVSTIDPAEDAGLVDVAGGTVVAGNKQVPWATFEQKLGSWQEIFVR